MHKASQLDYSHALVITWVTSHNMQSHILMWRFTFMNTQKANLIYNVFGCACIDFKGG